MVVFWGEVIVKEGIDLSNKIIFLSVVNILKFFKVLERLIEEVLLLIKEFVWVKVVKIYFGND